MTRGERLEAARRETQLAKERLRIERARPPQDRARACLEAIQNKPDDPNLEARLTQRFPEGLVRRLLELHRVSVDTEHKDWLQANRLILDILTPQQPKEEEQAAQSAAGRAITLVHGRVDVPLPGQQKNGNPPPSHPPVVG